MKQWSNTKGVRGLASMGLLDSVFGLGALKGGAGRDYSDLKPGDFPAETAQYALNNEVKAVSKVRFSWAWSPSFAPQLIVGFRMVTPSLLSEVRLAHYSCDCFGPSAVERSVKTLLH